MGTNLTQATIELTDLTTKIQNAIQSVEKEIVENVYNNLTGSPPYGTPIKTGWASANWVVSAQIPTGGQVADKGSVSTAKSHSQGTLATFLSSNLNECYTVFIDNRVSYINKLNNGSSTQSPADFVDLSVQAGAALLTRKRIG